ncbi:MAG: hypothetical protein C4533_03035 [Candidatus Omnitrophota bacterium]|jgi:TolA-binding protein|nr:MAG: hypothetical protein C4533_03035 [Candidatus Omnitrophota bacterium]
MKNRILLILALAFVVLGCSDRYAIEKRYWGLQKQAGDIFGNPHSTPPRQIEQVVKKFNGFANKYPGTNLAIDADFTIARLYAAKEDFDKAREQLSAIMKKYSNSPVIVSEAMALYGNSYEMENKWGLAVNEYKKVYEKYPYSRAGFELPIYIARHYKAKFQPESMNEAYMEAVAHYKTLIQDNTDPRIAINAYFLMTNCYMELKDWNAVVSAYDSIIKNYKDNPKAQSAVETATLNKALIYATQLKNLPKAKEILAEFTKRYPRSRLIKVANNLLKEIEKNAAK